MIVDYEFYANQYLHGKKPVLQPDDCEYWFEQGEKNVSIYCTPTTICNNDVTKKCICEVAEVLYNFNVSGKERVASEKVGDVSVTYTDGTAAQKILHSKIRNIVYKWLANTGALYKGVIK